MDDHIAAFESQFFTSAPALPRSNAPRSVDNFANTSPPEPSFLSPRSSSASSLSSASAALLPRTVLALDVGARQIGVAVSDATFSFPSPLTCLQRRVPSFPPSPGAPLTAVPLSSLASSLSQLIAQHQAAALVVGLPLNPDSSLSPHCLSIQQFVSSLLPLLPPLPVPAPLYWDETFSSRDGRERLRDAGLDVRRMKAAGVLDSVAACVILQSFIDWMHGLVDDERQRLRTQRRQQKAATAAAEPATPLSTATVERKM